MKHICVYTKERASNYGLYPFFVVEEIKDEANVKEAVRNVASEIVQEIENEIEQTDLLLDLDYFQVDSRIMTALYPILPDYAHWEDILNDRGLDYFAVHVIFDVLKAFEVTNACKTFTKEEIESFNVTRNRL